MDLVHILLPLLPRHFASILQELMVVSGILRKVDFVEMLLVSLLHFLHFVHVPHSKYRRYPVHVLFHVAQFWHEFRAKAIFILVGTPVILILIPVQIYSCCVHRFLLLVGPSVLACFSERRDCGSLL